MSIKYLINVQYFQKVTKPPSRASSDELKSGLMKATDGL